ncbi:HEAT repeat domain-containing protein [Cognatishimia sp. MH4019]|uniref:HEAT repeat domain-containing protein n=1 Tax=Cognatishimia sp. MH4019 TaxID=2854030 RepID=UPI001CD4FD57|nr:HEAT repeat domain-containing protein [Cognatishimia sp. MH4019]
MTAQAEMTLEDFQAQVMAGANRIAQYQQTLQNPDPRVQYEAVRLLLKSKDPALVRIAKEHALFSTNPVLRNSAIVAIFEAGGNLRLQVTATNEQSASGLQWISNVGGTHDGRVGNFIFPIGKMTEECWMDARYDSTCQLRVSGTTVQFYYHGNSGTKAQAALTLGSDGVLRGKLLAGGHNSDAAIDLKE